MLRMGIAASRAGRDDLPPESDLDEDAPCPPAADAADLDVFLLCRSATTGLWSKDTHPA